MNKNLTARLTATITPEMKERIKEAAEGEYTSQSEYGRAMIRAGESNIAAMDPRTTTATDISMPVAHNSAEAAAKAISDGTLLEEIPADESNKEDLEEVIERLVQEFENKIGDRIYELSQAEDSPVTQGKEGGYWLQE